MQFQTSLLFSSIMLAYLPGVFADFHYGLVDYTITTATGQIAQIVPASHANCTAAYDFYPKGVYGFDNVTGYIQLDICAKEVVLNVDTGAWYTHGRVILEGNCTAVNGTTGIKTPVCIIGNESGATWTDIWSCPGAVCDAVE